jgi:amino acid transporter
MASTGVSNSNGSSGESIARSQHSSDKKQWPLSDTHHPEKNEVQLETDYEESLPPSYDHTHRKLKARHIQLIGIGGTIGTALFVAIGKPLIAGGPANLSIAFTLW